MADYPLPKLDDFHSVGPAPTYEEKRRKLFEQLRGFAPGLHELILHPSVETEGLKRVTNSGQQRAWEDRLLADPQVRQFWAEQGIVVTDWKEVMSRFKGQRPYLPSEAYRPLQRQITTSSPGAPGASFTHMSRTPPSRVSAWK